MNSAYLIFGLCLCLFVSPLYCQLSDEVASAEVLKQQLNDAAEAGTLTLERVNLIQTQLETIISYKNVDTTNAITAYETLALVYLLKRSAVDSKGTILKMIARYPDKIIAHEKTFAFGVYIFQDEALAKPCALYLYNNAKSNSLSKAIAGIWLMRKGHVKSAPAPDFVIELQSQKKANVIDNEGKVVLLHFWASWCGPCKKEAPQLGKINQSYQTGNFVMLGINVDHDKEDAYKYIETNNLTWPQSLDMHTQKEPLSLIYCVSGIPDTVLIDKKGVIRYMGLRGEALVNAIEALVNEK